MSCGPVSGTRRRPSLLASIVAIAVASLLAAGCGGGGSTGVASVATQTTTAASATATHNGSGVGASSSGSSPSAPRGGDATVINIGNATEGTRFAACMRKHGVPNFPDPNSQGVIQFGAGIDPHSPLFSSARHSCQSLLPAGFGQAPTQAQLAQVQQQLVVFSKCMRTHGITNFPDPSGAALPQIQPTGDLDPNNPQFQTAYNACKTLWVPETPVRVMVR